MLVLFGLRRFGHGVDMQVLKHQSPVLFDEFVRRFVQKVPSLVPCFSVEPRQFFLGTMKLDLDMAYLAEMESLIDDGIATLWIGERVVAVSTFEAWVPWLFPILDTSEEGLHRFVKTFEHILLNLAMDVLIFFSQCFDGR